MRLRICTLCFVVVAVAVLAHAEVENPQKEDLGLLALESRLIVVEENVDELAKMMNKINETRKIDGESIESLAKIQKAHVELIMLNHAGLSDSNEIFSRISSSLKNNLTSVKNILSWQENHLMEHH